MRNAKNLSVLMVVGALALSVSAVSVAQEKDTRSPEEIQEEIERLELRRHETEARRMLVSAERAVVDEELALLAKQQQLRNGGIDQSKAINKANIPVVQAPPPFRWPELPVVKASGADEGGKIASLQYPDGTRINVRVGEVIRGGVKIKTISKAGVELSKSGKKRWIS